MAIHVKRHIVSLMDAKTTHDYYEHSWMEFVSRCPDLLTTPWFYEGHGVSENQAINMRKLIAVWTMLYGVDVVRILLKHTDFVVANACYQALTQVFGHTGISDAGEYCLRCLCTNLQFMDGNSGRCDHLLHELRPLQLTALPQVA